MQEEQELRTMPSDAMPPRDPAEEGQSPPAAEPKAQTAQEELLLGKFKSQDELAKAYAELEKRHGQQSGEIGSLRKEKEILYGQLEKGKSSSQPGSQASPATPAAPDFDAQLMDIQAKVDSGDLSIAEALKLSAEVSASKGAMSAMQQFQQQQQQQQAQQVQTQWLERNPDYTGFVGSQEHAAIMQANPLHDDFSAYHEWKAQRAATEAYEKGKSEVQSLAQGAEAGRKVLAGQGATIRQNNPAQTPAWKWNADDAKARALANLEKMGG